MRYRKQGSIYFVIFILSAISISCNLLNLGKGETARTQTPDPLATAAFEGSAGVIETAVPTQHGGNQVVIQFTEAEFNSAATNTLQNQSDPKIDNMQVRLRNERLRLTATVTTNEFPLPLPLDITVEVFADPQGRARSRVVSASVGPFSVPENEKRNLVQQIDQALLDQINADGKNIFVESVQIADGLMTVRGHTL